MKIPSMVLLWVGAVISAGALIGQYVGVNALFLLIAGLLGVVLTVGMAYRANAETAKTREHDRMQALTRGRVTLSEPIEPRRD